MNKKFRIWDEENLLYLAEQESWGAPIVSVALDGSVWVQYLSGDNKCETGYIIQQYIGIQDKNNKEIYEGDIIEFSLPADDTIYMGKVIWCEDTLSYGVSFSIESSEEAHIEDLYSVKWVKVLGNIFENPEMIKGKIER